MLQNKRWRDLVILGAPAFACLLLYVKKQDEKHLAPVRERRRLEQEQLNREGTLDDESMQGNDTSST